MDKLRPHNNPERSLWAAVALTALNDCLIPLKRQGNPDLDHDWAEYRLKAESYFRNPSRDLYELSLLAGIDPKSFIKTGIRLLELPEDEKARRRTEDRII